MMALGSRRTGVLFLLIVTLVMTAAYAAGVRWGPPEGPSPAQSHSATPAPGEPNPIYGESDAIQRSLARFPPEKSPTEEVARLITVQEFSDWQGEPVPEWDPGAPAWLVAVKGSGMQVKDALQLPAAGSSDARSALAAYFVWDANGGYLIAQGALLTLDQYDSVVALQTAPLTVQPATTLPPEPTTDPTYLPEFILTPAP